MATYYVATTGNDTTGDGSFNYAFGTITKALAEVSLGDTIILKNGTYPYFAYEGIDYEGDITEPLPVNTDWITMISENPHQATIEFGINDGNRCIDLGVGYGHNGSTKFIGIKFEDIVFHGQVYTNNIIGLRVSNCKSYSSQEFLDMSRYECGFKFGGNNASSDIIIKDTEICHHRKGIVISAYNVQVVNCDIYDIGVHFFFISGYDNILIEGNKIRDHSKYDDSHGDAIIFYSLIPMNNIVIRNNLIANHQNLGVYISWADTTLINDFVFENNLMYGIKGYALTMYNTNGAKIANNTIIGSVRFNAPGQTNLNGIQCFNNIITRYYSYGYDENWFTYHGKNIYIKGAGGGGYVNIGEYESDSLQIVKDTLPENTGLFVDALNGNYSLVANGAAVNFGRSLNAPATDILGVLRDAWPDAGCYEYTTKSTEVPTDPDDKDYPVDPPVVPDDPIETTATRTARFSAHFSDCGITADVSGTITWSSGTAPGGGFPV